MRKVPMTVGGADKLRDELNDLKTVQRPKIVQAIADQDSGLAQKLAVEHVRRFTKYMAKKMRQTPDLDNAT